MKIHLVSIKEITAKKDGKKFTILDGIKSSGETVKLFLNEYQANKFGPFSGLSPKPDVLSDSLRSLPEVEVSYDENGRVENLIV